VRGVFSGQVTKEPSSDESSILAGGNGGFEIHCLGVVVVAKGRPDFPSADRPLPEVF